MPRNMSFMLTTPQFRARTKRVTRRDGWLNAKPGQIVNGVEKGMGLKKGEKVQHLGPIRITDARWEPLNAITPEDVVLEGFPGWTPEQFVEMYCKHNKKRPTDLTHRIAYEYLDPCALCDGTGDYDGAACPECEGLGLVSAPTGYAAERRESAA